MQRHDRVEDEGGIAGFSATPHAEKVTLVRGRADPEGDATGYIASVERPRSTIDP